MASITLERVVKRYAPGAPPAVDGVSLSVRDGELVALVGPSGCGKSTLLRMIAGLEEITEGELRLDAERANEQGPRERGLAMVFQSYALYPHLTVFENVAFPLRLARRREEEIRRRVGDAVALLGLEELLDRKPGQLSGGQRQRVAIGRAIVREARAYLFDEPLSNLDARLRGQTRTELARLQRRLGVTTVYVTHDQLEAMTLGERVAVLRRGRLQQVARPRDLYARPVNLFVAGFIGSPPMNFVPATVDGGCLSFPFARVPLPAELLRRLPPGPLIAGIRPEHLADAALVTREERGRGAAFEAKVDLIEWLGDAQLAYAPYDAPRELAETIRSLARELDGEAPRTQLVVSLDARSGIRGGATARLWLDPRRVHVFDPRTGESLTAASAAAS
jgi:multiple sugar transport system ATP-binding protein